MRDEVESETGCTCAECDFHRNGTNILTEALPRGDIWFVFLPIALAIFLLMGLLFVPPIDLLKIEKLEWVSTAPAVFAMLLVSLVALILGQPWGRYRILNRRGYLSLGLTLAGLLLSAVGAVLSLLTALNQTA